MARRPRPEDAANHITVSEIIVVCWHQVTVADMGGKQGWSVLLVNEVE